MERLADGGWSTPRHLGDAVNGSGSETNSSIAADGTLYFAVSGAQGRRDLLRARMTRDGYATPEPLPAPINSDADESNHWIAPDQSYLLFLSNRRGGIGENDLYISFRDGNGWRTPRNLGAPVNRPGASGVFTPFVSADGHWLYFAERRSALDPLPERALDAAELDAYLRSPGNGQGDPEIETLFQVRLARGQLAADWEIAAPGPAAMRHGDRHLFGQRQGEEGAALLFQLGQNVQRDAMAGQVEEAIGIAGARHGIADRPTPCGVGAIQQPGHVDDGQRVGHLTASCRRR